MPAHKPSPLCTKHGTTPNTSPPCSEMEGLCPQPASKDSGDLCFAKADPCLCYSVCSHPGMRPTSQTSFSQPCGIFYFFVFPCHNHSSNPFGFIPPLLKEGQSLPSLNPQLWPELLPGRGQGRPRSQHAGGVSWQDSVSPALSPNTAKDCPVRG